MSFRKRGFQELVDDILTELTGGIVNEPIRFVNGDAPIFPLGDAPVTRIAAVTGTVGGEFHQFGDTDFELTGDGTAIQWLGATRPDEGSTFFVDYYPESARSPITDRNVGSVARTLVEAIGREVAVLYGQLDLVYKSGFIDLAEGAALDFVVALLGLQRIRAGRQVGEVVFGRSTPAPGDITIPLGTIVATPPQGEDQEVFEFETTATRTMRQGQAEATAPIRFRPTPEQAAAFTPGQVPAGAISLIPKPIVGIETVTNPEATTRGAEDESDEQLRQRAKKALAEAGKSTVDALRAAVLRHGPGVNVVVQDMPRGAPGEVDLVISGADDGARQEAIVQSVLATKAAGVMVQTNLSMGVEVTLKLRLETQDDVQLGGDEMRRIESTIKSAVVNYINNLKAGEDISRNALVALSLSDTRLRNVVVEELCTQRKDLQVPDTATRLRDATGALTASFKITDRVLDGLRSEGVPDDILAKLESIKNQEVRGEERFVDVLRSKIGDEQTARYRSLILQNAASADLAGFDHVNIGQLEKAGTTEADVTVTVEIGEAEVTTAVRITVTVVGNRTDAGSDVQEEAIKPQVETLVRGFVESPERGAEIRLADLIEFVQSGSGLFTVRSFPDSFFVAEHLGTGQVDREVDVVRLGEKERAELESLILRLV